MVPDATACAPRCEAGFMPTQQSVPCDGGRLDPFECKPAYLRSADTCIAEFVPAMETELAVPACCDADSCTCTGAAVPFAEAAASCSRLCSSDEISSGACATCNAGGCGGPVWTRSRLPCSSACVAAFVDDCVVPLVEGGTDATEALS